MSDDTITLPNGTVLSGEMAALHQMTPLERHNKMAASMGAKPAERPSANLFPVTGLTDQTAAELARGDARAAKAPPSTAVVPAKQTADPDAVAKFDAEMRAAGKQLPTEADEQKFRVSSVKWLESWCNQQPEDWQRANEPKMQEWAAKIQAGEAFVRWNDTKGAVELHARTAPSAQPRNSDGTFAPASEAATSAALDKATKASNKYGFADAKAITGPLLFGYTIAPNREYHVAELVAGLRLARGGNLTQEQVNQIIARSGA